MKEFVFGKGYIIKNPKPEEILIKIKIEDWLDLYQDLIDLPESERNILTGIGLNDEPKLKRIHKRFISMVEAGYDPFLISAVVSKMIVGPHLYDNNNDDIVFLDGNRRMSYIISQHILSACGYEYILNAKDGEYYAKNVRGMTDEKLSDFIRKHSQRIKYNAGLQRSTMDLRFARNHDSYSSSDIVKDNVGNSINSFPDLQNKNVIENPYYRKPTQIDAFKGMIFEDKSKTSFWSGKSYTTDDISWVLKPNAVFYTSINPNVSIIFSLRPKNEFLGNMMVPRRKSYDQTDTDYRNMLINHLKYHINKLKNEMDPRDFGLILRYKIDKNVKTKYELNEYLLEEEVAIGIDTPVIATHIGFISYDLPEVLWLEINKIPIELFSSAQNVFNYVKEHGKPKKWKGEEIPISIVQALDEVQNGDEYGEYSTYSELVKHSDNIFTIFDVISQDERLNLHNDEYEKERLKILNNPVEESLLDLAENIYDSGVVVEENPKKMCPVCDTPLDKKHDELDCPYYKKLNKKTEREFLLEQVRDKIRLNYEYNELKNEQEKLEQENENLRNKLEQENENLRNKLEIERLKYKPRFIIRTKSGFAFSKEELKAIVTSTMAIFEYHDYQLIGGNKPIKITIVKDSVIQEKDSHYYIGEARPKLNTILISENIDDLDVLLTTVSHEIAHLYLKDSCGFFEYIHSTLMSKLKPEITKLYNIIIRKEKRQRAFDIRVKEVKEKDKYINKLVKDSSVSENDEIWKKAIKSEYNKLEDKKTHPSQWGKRYRENPGELVYRAADDNYNGPGSVWAENREDAEKYLDNGRFGGADLYTGKISDEILNATYYGDDIKNDDELIVLFVRDTHENKTEYMDDDEVLDYIRAEGLAELIEGSSDRRYPYAIWELSDKVKQELIKQGYKNILYTDDFPAYAKVRCILDGEVEIINVEENAKEQTFEDKYEVISNLNPSIDVEWKPYRGKYKDWTFGNTNYKIIQSYVGIWNGKKFRYYRLMNERGNDITVDVPMIGFQAINDIKAKVRESEMKLNPDESNIFYHWTLKSNLQKILKYGLKPKLDPHMKVSNLKPYVINLTDKNHINMWKAHIDDYYYENKDFVLLKIKINKNKVHLINKKDGWFVSYTKISPENIEIVDLKNNPIQLIVGALSSAYQGVSNTLSSAFSLGDTRDVLTDEDLVEEPDVLTNDDLIENPEYGLIKDEKGC